MSYDTPNYQIIEKEGQFEIRLYEPYTIAKVAVERDVKTGSMGFTRIFNYISGNNSKKEQIAMTAPVFNWDKEMKYYTAFVMPRKYNDKSLPLPDDSGIKIEKVPSKKMAAYRFSGIVSQQNVSKNEDALFRWLKEKNYEILSESRLARYNSPYSIPVLRRNEILFEVTEKK